MAEQILARLEQNVAEVIHDPSQPLDSKLFYEAELALPEAISSEQQQKLVTSIAQLLPTLNQDPSSAAALLGRLLQEYSYREILKLVPVPFADGLTVGEHMVPFNRLILTILGKATSESDVASVAGMLDTTLALVRLWLCTSDAGIASECSRVLVGLLANDCAILSTPGVASERVSGLFWKRMFGDRDIYRLFFSICSLKGPVEAKINKSQRTLAQARLMDWIPKVARMNWTVFTESQHPDIESEFSFDGGLLDFAALHMVDTRDDILMHRCLIDFFSELVTVAAKEPKVPREDVADSIGLLYLTAKGLHLRTSVIYLQLPGQQIDPLEGSFLYGPAANYVATYASHHPKHYMASQMPAQVHAHLSSALGLSPARWAHAESLKHDLHVLVSIPRQSLLDESNLWGPNPLVMLPSKATNPDVLNTLAAIFHGPERNGTTFPIELSNRDHHYMDQKEAAAARVLYFRYLAANPRFWSDIVVHADTVALKDLALAAINCFGAVVTANWHSESELDLPNTIATPNYGHQAILSPPALEYAIAYLLKPPQMFTNLVGGRGDVEAAAYKIATAKFNVLSAFQIRLVGEVERQPGQGYEAILATVNKCIGQGAFRHEGQIGGQVSTMEL